jgi:uncharacterized cofD-like protein
LKLNLFLHLLGGLLQSSPKKIVIFGGGGGINPIIQGLKDLYDVTAIVSVFDDGGSTGRLRDHSGIAVGDFRNALTAMARGDENKAIVDVLNYRFRRNDIGVFFHLLEIFLTLPWVK